MKIYYRLYCSIITALIVLSFLGCRSTNSFSCVWQNPIDYAYDGLTRQSNPSNNNANICGIYKNRKGKELFEATRRLILNCDSTFTWKYISCIKRDTCYGRWTEANNVIYLSTTKKLKKKVAKQNKQEFGDVFSKYVDLDNSTLIFNDSFIIWSRNTNWTDTLYRH